MLVDPVSPSQPDGETGVLIAGAGGASSNARLV